MLKPWLWLDPKIAHDLGPIAVPLYSALSRKKDTPVWSPFSWKNLNFKNRLGLAGGVDKNAINLKSWQNLGCGFIEVGTVTPLQQKPNPGKIIDRSIKDEALWNKMGFPSAGSDRVLANMQRQLSVMKIPILVNLGKNRTTTNESAHVDYCQLISKFHSLADAFVVNISSPNTSGLRSLASEHSLEAFLKPIRRQMMSLNCNKPLLLKLSPDLEPDDLKRILDVSIQNAVDGFVLTNTTLSRNGIKKFPDEGGVSGKPLAALSKLSLNTAIKHLGAEKSKKLIISVGGVMTEEDVFERLSMGADLVEVYTALIFSGLNFFRKVEKAAHESKQVFNSKLS